MKEPNKKERRARERANQQQKSVLSAPVQHPNAAGIDIAASADLWVAVGEHACSKPVRSFSPLTPGVRKLCEWLKECRVDTVAMEATGIYWLNLYLALREAGFDVVVVNPRTAKSLNRKTDISDCQWLRYLHSVGLLKASFVPPEQILALRTLSRHRENLLRASMEHVHRVQKALDAMNLHLHHVIDDITGVTGQAIIEAILQGERNAQRLAALRDRRIKASPEKMEQALEGRWNEEQLFVLGQEYQSYQHLQKQIAECDRKLLESTANLPTELSEEALAAQMEATCPQSKPRRAKRTKGKSKNGLSDSEQWQKRLHLLMGVDLTLTPGISILTVLCLLCELGTNWSCFPSAGHFASWLGLCPNNQVSGGKVLRRSTRTVQNRVRQMLKMAAQSLHRSQSHLGDQYRRMRGRLGPAQANTAMAHKLARILWHQMTYKVAYDESFLATLDQRQAQRRSKTLQKQAAKLGFKLVPLNPQETKQAA